MMDTTDVIFWTNFEIISLDWIQSYEYNSFMEYIDKTAGFYLERWGDAPLRTLAVVETLSIDEVQWFDIGYYHNPFSLSGKFTCSKVKKMYLVDLFDQTKATN